MSSSLSPQHDSRLPLPPSPTRPDPKRSVTAPQLAAALEATFNPDGTERRPSRKRNIAWKDIEEGQESLPSGDSSQENISKDKLNDLGTGQSTPGVYGDDSDPGRRSSPCFEAWTNRLPTGKAWQTYFMQEVAGDKYLEFQLLLMTIATGILDAMTYTTYSVFASKQTGNTLFLALYALRTQALTPLIEQNVGVSMGVFIAGAIFFGHIGHISRQRRRIWLLLSNGFQGLLMLAAAAVRYFVSRRGNGPGALAILALLAFAESGQIANALNVSMPELNTTMITGALIQLCTDKRFFKLKNDKRNRRLAFFASMLIGCFIGASIIRYSTPSACLVVVASAKGLLFFTFFFNRGLVQRRYQAEDGQEKVEGTITPASRVLWGD